MLYDQNRITHKNANDEWDPSSQNEELSTKIHQKPLRAFFLPMRMMGKPEKSFPQHIETRQLRRQFVRRSWYCAFVCVWKWYRRNFPDFQKQSPVTVCVCVWFSLPSFLMCQGLGCDVAGHAIDGCDSWFSPCFLKSTFHSAGSGVSLYVLSSIDFSVQLMLLPRGLESLRSKVESRRMTYDNVRPSLAETLMCGQTLRCPTGSEHRNDPASAPFPCPGRWCYL